MFCIMLQSDWSHIIIISFAKHRECKIAKSSFPFHFACYTLLNMFKYSENPDGSPVISCIYGVPRLFTSSHIKISLRIEFVTHHLQRYLYKLLCISDRYSCCHINAFGSLIIRIYFLNHHYFRRQDIPPD